MNGYEGLYQVSNFGNIKSLARPVDRANYKRWLNTRVLSPHKNCYGYMVVTLRKNKKHLGLQVHRLVAKAFIPNPYKKRCVNHKDGNKTNNHVDNLEWVTHQENTIHAWETGLQVMTPERCHKNKVNSSKKVNQYDLNGNLLHTWESQSQAAEHLHIHQTVISNCCLGKQKTGKGFIFKFVKEEDKNAYKIV